MALVTGTRLGPYEVLAPIGAGGMGEVYRARDTRLGRDVAVKVLPDEVSADPRALARFEAEARAVAALSHPNILALYDVGEAGGIRFAVTELLEGETLRRPLERGPLPVRRALDLAVEIAEGLAAAHEKGIVHRDVKPDNVFLTKEGHAKLLDFGLARQACPTRGPSDGQSPTVALLTEAGSMAGTVAYMSPEQPGGYAVDHRSDQFSFGVVLYEMLAGRRPFAGATVAETLTAILREEPEPLERAAPAVPAPLRWIVERCLAKEPSGRYASTSDLARDLGTCRQHLSEIITGAAAGPIEAAATRRGPARLALRAALFAAAALALLGAGALLDRLVGRGTEPGVPPRLVRLTWEPGHKRFSSISPDGTSFVYENGPRGRADILFRRIGGENAINLTKDCPEEDTMPAFSPDGQSIAFRSGRLGGGLFVMGAMGESVRRLTDFGFEPAWSPDGRTIAFATDRVDTGLRGGNSEIWIQDVAGGARRKLFDGDGVHPSWSPSGTRIAFHRRKGIQRGTALATVSASGGPATDVVELTSNLSALPAWTPGGIVFASTEGGAIGLWRVRVDEATGSRVDSPVRITTSTRSTWFPSATPDGRRILFTSTEETRSLVHHAFDPAGGKVLPGSRVVLSGPRQVRSPRPSPDGEWLATVLFEEDIQDLLLVRTTTGETRRLTNDALREDYLSWAADGARIYFSVAPDANSEVWSLRPDGSGREKAAAVPGEDVVQPLPSPDGRYLYVQVGARDVRPAVVDLRLPVAERRPVPLPLMADGRLFLASGWSQDGLRLVGFPADRSGEASYDVTLFEVERRSYRKAAALGAEHGCAFLPDSRRILLWRKGELRVLDPETGSLTPAGSVGDGFRALRLSGDGRSLVGDTVTIEGDIWMLDYGPPRK